MKKVKLILSGVAILSVLSLSGCCLLDPFWWDGPHGGYDHHDGDRHGEWHDRGRSDYRGRW